MPAHTRIPIALVLALITFTISGKTQLLPYDSSSVEQFCIHQAGNVLDYKMETAKIHKVKYIAKKQDWSCTIIFFFLLFAAIISLPK